MTKTLSWLLLMALVLNMAACADNLTRRRASVDRSDFQQRIRIQERRIERGIGSGELTHREAVILRENLNWIKSRYSSMKADGTLTSTEMEKLDLMLQRNSRMIYDKKHNAVQHLI